ncbi:MAG: hypothetical protein J7L38_00905 [Thermoproteales archaeon]|nr:hypothetical protein [Thermoproteales archaeon]
MFRRREVEIRPLRNNVGGAVVTAYRIGALTRFSQLVLWLLEMEIIVASGTWTGY